MEISSEKNNLIEENDELRLQLRKLNRQNKNFQNTITRFEKVSAAKDKLANIMRSERFRQAQYFNAMFQNSQDIIIFLDFEKRFVYCTNVFLKVAGIDHFEMIDGQRIEDVLSIFMDTNIIEEALETICDKREADSLVIENVIFAGKGEMLNLTVHISTIFNADEELDRILLICHDTTVLRRSKEEAEAANRAKSSFLATISHEIRTPLNAIIGLSEIQLQKKLPNDTSIAFERILGSGTNLLNIVNDVLDFSKIEAGNFAIIPVQYDTPSLINDTIHLNMMRLEDKPIEFDLKINHTLPVKLYGDELRVKQVLNNILSNAFKYTKEGTITLDVDWEKKEENRTLIFVKVSDTGIGIKKEDLGKLFSEYSQLDGKANRKIEGTGLGLAITKRLVEMMNGQIEVESTYGKGSIFTITLEQEIVDETPIGDGVVENLRSFRFTEEKLYQSKNLARNLMPYGRVLIVDDVAINLDVAKGLMLPYGLQVDCALSGMEAIEMIRAQEIKYHAVFMDHMMPQMDGIEAVRIIRNEIDSEYAKTVPIIALTANAITGNEEMFLKNGFNSFISKPIDIMRLDVILNQFVHGKGKTSSNSKTEDKKMGETSNLEGVTIEGIDISEGIKRYGKESIFLKILASYALHTPKLLDKLRKPTPETLSDYTITVHGLKSASLGICANNVGKQAEALEFAAKANDWALINTNNDTFIKTAEKLVADLNVLLGNASSGSKEKISAPDTALLAELLEAATRFKSVVMDEIVTKLENYEYESGGELVPWLREQLENLEYDAIQERLKSLL